jgi:hypothetical protein
MNLLKITVNFVFPALLESRVCRYIDFAARLWNRVCRYIDFAAWLGSRVCQYIDFADSMVTYENKF